MISDTRQVFADLYTGVDGYKLSAQVRKNLDHWYVGHTYGEITYSGFVKMLAAAYPKEGEVFYDFGSGTGKAVFLAALLAPLHRAVGIELFPELNDTAASLIPKYRSLTGNRETPIISFVQGNFKEQDFSDADIIFINATCMDYDFDLPFVRKLELLKKGTRVLTNSLYFISETYSLHTLGPMPFSWGEEEIFLHVKK